MTREETALVTGGRGFIGRALVPMLRREGYRVRVFSRMATNTTEDPGVHHLRGDVADPAAVRAAVEGVSVVYDLAMSLGTTWEYFQRYCIGGAENVARACQAGNVRRLIYASSIAAVYTGRQVRIDERDGTDAKPHARDFYTRAKIEAERLLLKMHANSGLPVVIMRPAIVVGREGNVTHFGVGQWREGIHCLAFGRGRHPLPFVLVEDVASAMLLAAQAPGIEGMSFNLAGDVRLSSQRYVEILAERSLRNYRLHPQNLIGLYAQYFVKWALKCLFGRADAVKPSYRDLKCCATFADFDCSLAKEKLNWKPNASLEVFIREAIDSHLKPIAPGDLRLAGDAAA